MRAVLAAPRAARTGRGVPAGVAWLVPVSVACAAAQPPSLCGQVVDDRRAPIPGAIVRTATGDVARTDADGRFCVAGATRGVRLTATADGHCPGPAVVVDGRWARLTIPRQLVADSVWQAGFGADVELRASLRCPLPGPAVFRWDQLEGPALGEAAQGSATPVLRFRTEPLQARTARPDVLALSPREAGHYLFRVTARGGGFVARAEAAVTAASVLAGLLSVPPDTDVYVDSGSGRPPGIWRLAQRPPGSRTVLLPVPTADGAAGVVRARLDRNGLYEFVEQRGGTRFVFEAGPWDTIPRDCDRVECHPGEQVEWVKTRHAKALDDRLDQPTPEPFGKRCLACHSVGWDPGARAGGFDDVADDVGVHPRDAWPGGARALPRDLRRLANVWCIDCHGPGRLPEHGKRPMVVRVGVCGQCHDAPPKYPRVQEWQRTKMSRAVTDPALCAERCAGCHTAQGAVTRQRGRIVRAVPPDVAEPITCQVCHVAHTGEEHLLRSTGTVAEVSGLLFEAGKGAACLGCHQANGRADEAAEAARHLPEAPQTEVLFGRGAFGAAGQPFHVTRNLCVDCHMARCIDCHADADRYRGGHTFRSMPVAVEAPEDCDGDGRIAPLAEEVEGCLARAAEALQAELSTLPGCAGARLGRDGERLVPRSPDGGPLPACEAEWMRPERAALYRAAHDQALIVRDGSKGAHNPAFTIHVLRAILAALNH